MISPEEIEAIVSGRGLGQSAPPEPPGVWGGYVKPALHGFTGLVSLPSRGLTDILAVGKGLADEGDPYAYLNAPAGGNVVSDIFGTEKAVAPTVPTDPASLVLSGLRQVGGVGMGALEGDPLKYITTEGGGGLLGQSPEERRSFSDQGGLNRALSYGEVAGEKAVELGLPLAAAFAAGGGVPAALAGRAGTLSGALGEARPAAQIASMAIDPTLGLMSGLGIGARAGKEVLGMAPATQAAAARAMGAGFIPGMALGGAEELSKARETYGQQGMSPEVLSEALGGVSSLGFAGLGALHALAPQRVPPVIRPEERLEPVVPPVPERPPLALDETSLPEAIARIEAERVAAEAARRPVPPPIPPEAGGLGFETELRPLTPDIPREFETATSYPTGLELNPDLVRLQAEAQSLPTAQPPVAPYVPPAMGKSTKAQRAAFPDLAEVQLLADTLRREIGKEQKDVQKAQDSKGKLLEAESRANDKVLSRPLPEVNPGERWEDDAGGIWRVSDNGQWLEREGTEIAYPIGSKEANIALNGRLYGKGTGPAKRMSVASGPAYEPMSTVRSGELNQSQLYDLRAGKSGPGTKAGRAGIAEFSKDEQSRVERALFRRRFGYERPDPSSRKLTMTEFYNSKGYLSPMQERAEFAGGLEHERVPIDSDAKPAPSTLKAQWDQYNSRPEEAQFGPIAAGSDARVVSGERRRGAVEAKRASAEDIYKSDYTDAELAEMSSPPKVKPETLDAAIRSVAETFRSGKDVGSLGLKAIDFDYFTESNGRVAVTAENRAALADSILKGSGPDYDRVRLAVESEMEDALARRYERARENAGDLAAPIPEEADASFRPEEFEAPKKVTAGEFVTVDLEDGTTVKGKVRDVVGDEAYVFVSGPRAEELHDAGGSLTVPLSSVKPRYSVGKGGVVDRPKMTEQESALADDMQAVAENRRIRADEALQKLRSKNVGLGQIITDAEITENGVLRLHLRGRGSDPGAYVEIDPSTSFDVVSGASALAQSGAGKAGARVRGMMWQKGERAFGVNFAGDGPITDALASHEFAHVFLRAMGMSDARIIKRLRHYEGQAREQWEQNRRDLLERGEKDPGEWTSLDEIDHARALEEQLVSDWAAGKFDEKTGRLKVNPASADLIGRMKDFWRKIMEFFFPAHEHLVRQMGRMKEEGLFTDESPLRQFADRLTERMWGNEGGRTPEDRGQAYSQGAAPFYSQLERVINDKRFPQKASAQDYIRYLKDSKRGVKQDELYWSGVEDLLSAKSASGEKVTADEIRAAFKQGSESSRTVERLQGNRGDKELRDLSDLAARRSESYREEVWPFDSERKKETYARLRKEADDAYERYLQSRPKEATAYDNYHPRGIDNPRNILHDAPNLTPGPSGHFGEKNLYHARIGELKLEDGTDARVITELQSDRGQQGREQGFAKPYMEKGHERYTEESRRRLNDARTAVVRADSELGRLPDDAPEQIFNEANNRLAEAMAAEEQVRREVYGGQVPDMPRRESKDWVSFMLKREIRRAAEEGVRTVLIPKGEWHHQKYESDTRTKVDMILWDKSPSDKGVSIATIKNGKRSNIGIFDESKLAEVLGKDLAEKITSGVRSGEREGMFEGKDIVLSPGLIKFYNETVAPIAEGIVRKIDPGVRLKEETHRGTDYWRLDLTDKVIDSALNQGFPLYAVKSGPRELPKGIVEFAKDRDAFKAITARAREYARDPSRPLLTREEVAAMFPGEDISPSDLDLRTAWANKGMDDAKNAYVKLNEWRERYSKARPEIGVGEPPPGGEGIQEVKHTYKDGTDNYRLVWKNGRIEGGVNWMDFRNGRVPDPSGQQPEIAYIVGGRTLMDSPVKASDLYKIAEENGVGRSDLVTFWGGIKQWRDDSGQSGVVGPNGPVGAPVRPAPTPGGRGGGGTGGAALRSASGSLGKPGVPAARRRVPSPISGADEAALLAENIRPFMSVEGGKKKQKYSVTVNDGSGPETKRLGSREEAESYAREMDDYGQVTIHDSSGKMLWINTGDRAYEWRDVVKEPVKTERSNLKSGWTIVVDGMDESPYGPLSKKEAEHLRSFYGGKKVEIVDRSTLAEQPPYVPRKPDPSWDRYSVESPKESKREPGPHPLVERDVEDFFKVAGDLRDGIEDPHARAAFEKKLTLARDNPQKWDADFEAEVQKKLRAKTPEQWANTMNRRLLTAVEKAALQDGLKGKRDRIESLQAEVDKARESGQEGRLAELNAEKAAAAMEWVSLERAQLNDRTGTARALAALAKLRSSGIMPDKDLARIFKSIPGITDAKAAALVEIMKDKTKSHLLGDALRDAIDPSVSDKVMEAWKAGLVSALPTPAANIGSTGLEQAARVVETAMSAGIRKMTGQGGDVTGETGAEIRGMVKANAPALGHLWKNLKDAFTLKAEKIDLDSGKPLEYQTGAIGGKLGRAVRLPFRLLDATDKYFFEVAASAETHKQAYRRAMKDVKEGKAQDVESRYEEIVRSLAEKKGEFQDIRVAADKAARERIFREDPDKALEALNRMRSALGPVGHIILPFTTTPWNIAKMAGRRSPLGMKKFFKWYMEERALAQKEGRKMNPMPPEVGDDLARAMLGTAIFGSMLAAANGGLITGSGPTDTKKRKLLQDTGWQPYSFKIGDNYVPFSRFEPISTVMGIAADFGESIASGKEMSRSDLLDKFFGSFAQNVTNKTYLKGLSDAANLISDPMQFGQQYLRNISGSVVPNIVRKGAQLVDPTVRELRPEGEGPGAFVESLGRAVASGIPGLSKGLPERRTATGRPADRESTGIGFFSPVRPTSEKADREVERLLLRADYVPAEPPRTKSIQGVRIPLTDAEYQELLDSRAKATAYISRKLVGNADFEKRPDIGGRGSKNHILERIYNQALNDAWDRIMEKNAKSLRERYRAKKDESLAKAVATARYAQ